MIGRDNNTPTVDDYIPPRTVKVNGRRVPSKATTWDERVDELILEGLTWHDAQDVADAEGWDR